MQDADYREWKAARQQQPQIGDVVAHVESNPLAAKKREIMKRRLTVAYERHLEGRPSRLLHVIAEFARMKINYLELEFYNVGTANTLDDFVQEATFAVWQGLSRGSFRGDSKSFYAYVHSICFKTATDGFNELKKAKYGKKPLLVEGRDSDGFLTGEQVDNPILTGDDPGGDIYGFSLPKSIQRTDRNICLLIGEGLNYAEIADHLRMTEAAIKQRMQKVRQRAQAERKLEREKSIERWQRPKRRSA